MYTSLRMYRWYLSFSGNLGIVGVYRLTDRVSVPALPILLQQLQERGCCKWAWPDKPLASSLGVTGWLIWYITCSASLAT